MRSEEAGQTIALLRRQAGLTQWEVAERMGISDKAVSKWERGLSFPDVASLERLADILHTDIDILVSGSLASGEHPWHGILLLEEKNAVPIDTIVYDKPLVYYPLSLFLLVGIREIHVCCTEDAARRIETATADLQRSGVLVTPIAPGWLPPSDIAHYMLVCGQRLLYGAGLTRRMQLAMSGRDTATVLTILRRGGQHGIAFDNERKIIQYNETAQPHTVTPVFFVSGAFAIRVMRESLGDPARARERLLAQERLYARPLGRGVVELPLESWDDVAEASTLIRILQKQSGEPVCDPLDIAGRRGLV